MPMAYSRTSPMPATVVLAAVRGPYPEAMNPRARRLIVSGVLGALVVIVVVSSLLGWLR